MAASIRSCTGPRRLWTVTRADPLLSRHICEDRQPALERLFIQAARQLPNQRFLIGSAVTSATFPWADKIYFARHVPPSEHPAFFCSGRLTLNVTRQAMADMGHCPSGRLFEAAACGAPILSDWWAGLDEFFTPGVEILVARGTERFCFGAEAAAR